MGNLDKLMSAQLVDTLRGTTTSADAAVPRFAGSSSIYSSFANEAKRDTNFSHPLKVCQENEFEEDDESLAVHTVCVAIARAAVRERRLPAWAVNQLKLLLLGVVDVRVALHQGSQKELRSVCFLEGGRPRRGDPAAPELAGEGSAAVSALRGVQVLAWRRARGDAVLFDDWQQLLDQARTPPVLAILTLPICCEGEGWAVGSITCSFVRDPSDAELGEVRSFVRVLGRHITHQMKDAWEVSWGALCRSMPLPLLERLLCPLGSPSGGSPSLQGRALGATRGAHTLGEPSHPTSPTPASARGILGGPVPCGEHSPPATHSTSHIKARGDAADASGESLCSRCRRPRDTPVLSPALSLRGHGAKGNAQQAQQTCLEEAQSLLLSCSAAECAVGTGAAAGRAGTGEAGSAAPSVTAPCGTSGNDGDTTGRSRSGMSDALEALQWGRAAQNTGRGSRAPQPAQHDGTAKWRQQPPHQGGFLASGSEVVAEDLSASGGGAGEWWQVSCKSSTAAQCGKWSSGSFESKGTASDVEEPADHGWAYWKKSQAAASQKWTLEFDDGGLEGKFTRGYTSFLQRADVAAFQCGTPLLACVLVASWLKGVTALMSTAVVGILIPLAIPACLARCCGAWYSRHRAAVIVAVQLLAVVWAIWQSFWLPGAQSDSWGRALLRDGVVLMALSTLRHRLLFSQQLLATLLGTYLLTAATCCRMAGCGGGVGTSPSDHAAACWDLLPRLVLELGAGAGCLALVYKGEAQARQGFLEGLVPSKGLQAKHV